MTQPPDDELGGLLSQVAEDLASSTIPTLEAPGEDHSLTLREAVAKILDSTSSLSGLTERPLPPKDSDDLRGHVLSLRAEHLTTLALVAGLADHLGVDINSLIAKSQSIYGK